VLHHNQTVPASMVGKLMPNRYPSISAGIEPSSIYTTTIFTVQTAMQDPVSSTRQFLRFLHRRIWLGLFASSTPRERSASIDNCLRRCCFCLRTVQNAAEFPVSPSRYAGEGDLLSMNLFRNQIRSILR